MIDLVPPKGAQEAARRALEVRATKPPSERGMTAVGLARARDLANGKALSPETVRRMLSFFARHEVDKQGATWDEQGKGWQAWHGWGGDAGYAWARKVVEQMDSRQMSCPITMSADPKRYWNRSLYRGSHAPTRRGTQGRPCGAPTPRGRRRC